MSSTVSASVTEKTRKHVTPFDEVLACEAREEARVQAVLDELAVIEKDAEEGMRDAEITQEEKLRMEAKQVLMDERDALGKHLETQEQELLRELDVMEKDVRSRMPAVTHALVDVVLASDFFTAA